jgi:hypothetical protein
MTRKYGDVIKEIGRGNFEVLFEEDNITVKDIIQWEDNGIVYLLKSDRTMWRTLDKEWSYMSRLDKNISIAKFVKEIASNPNFTNVKQMTTQLNIFGKS